MHRYIKKNKLKKYWNIFRQIINLRKNASVLKSLYYSIKFRGRIFIGKKSSLKMDKTAKIIIKNNAFLGIGLYYKFPAHTIIHMGHNAQIIVNGNSQIMKGCFIEIMPGAIFEIGAGSSINEQSRIKVSRRLYVGNDCAISFKVHIIDSDIHKISKTDNINKVTNEDVTKEIIIEDHVWIGTNVIILKGVRICKGSVIGAGSVVTKDIPEHVLAAGNPCKVIKENIKWKR